MKKFAKATALALAFALVLTVCMSAIAAAGTIKLTSGSLTVRKSASTSSASVAKVTNGTKVDVLKTSGDWYQIKVSNKTGYVQKKYVTMSTSSTGTTAGSPSTANSIQVKVNIAKATIYKTASTKSGSVTTAVKDTILPVTGSTASWYKVNSNGTTGWIPKKNVVVATGATSSGSSSGSSASSSSGSSGTGSTDGGYKNSTITMPAEPVTTSVDLLNAINYNFTKFNETFTIKVKNYKQDMLPTRTRQLEYGYTAGNINPTLGTPSGDVTPITFTVKYNPAGQVIASYTMNKSITDSKATTLKNKVDSIISKIITNGMSQTQKVVAIHDYIVENTAYTAKSNDASRALIDGQAACQAYAEANAVLLSAVGIENRFVWADSKVNTGGTHGFNKVKVDGKWYNVDCTVDDPQPNVAGRIKRDYLMVDDEALRQRYTWEEARYPASTDANNNWHYQNNFVATTQAELVKIVTAEAAKKNKQISVWVKDYSTGGKYTTSFASRLPGVKSVKVTTTAAATSYKTFQTALFFEVTY